LGTGKPCVFGKFQYQEVPIPYLFNIPREPETPVYTPQQGNYYLPHIVPLVVAAKLRVRERQTETVGRGRFGYNEVVLISNRCSGWRALQSHNS